jgi:hypothetical protein
MATTTPNYGWAVPTSTDLVKDGAVAIETLGDSIDASLADLKGGTTGQVLSKATNTDMDFTWVAQDDSNAIQNAIVDAKGDLIGATAADTPARLAVGTNGQVLTADSTAGTGLAWTTLTAGATVKSVRKSSDQTVTSSTTLVNDSQLKFAVAASETYIFQAWLYTYAADGTPDIKVTFTGPAGSTVFWSSSQVIFNAGGSTTLTVVAPGATTADLFVDSNLRAIQLYGTILNSTTAGDLQFQWAQNTSSANGTSVKAGSSIFGIKV